MVIRIILVVVVCSITTNLKNYIHRFENKESKTISLEATTFNDDVFAYGKAPKQGNRYKGKLIAALDKKFMKKNKIKPLQTIHCVIEYITKKGNITKHDSIIVKDIINSRFNGKRIDLYDKNATNSDNIKSVKLKL